MEIKFTLIVPEHLSEILFLLAHHRTSDIVGVFASEKQKQFYDFAILNLKYTNIICETFASVKANPASVNGKIVVLMDIPHNFETLKQTLAASKSAQQIIVVLMKENKKYINMAGKKIGQGYKIITTSDYSKNQLVGINSKLRDLVDQSYDMNRAAFYAYGAYLNYFRQNMLKFIFKTEAIDVTALAKSFGFTTPPRVKDGKFLKVSVRKQKVSQKKAEKKVLKKKGSDHKQEKQEEEESVLRKTKAKKLSIKEIAHLKTKKILKNKVVVLKSKPKSKVAKKTK